MTPRSQPERSRHLEDSSGRGFERFGATGVMAQLFLLLALGLTDCAPESTRDDRPILLFTGTGTSPNDVKAIATILKARRLEYTRVNSRQLNGMTEAQLATHRLMIIPGGNYLDMGQGLTANTLTNLHRAVAGGLNYLGICAGGLLAGNIPGPSLNLTEGVRFDFYAAVNRGVHKTSVVISSLSDPPLEQYWEDGPQFTGWGEVVGKYPDGTPAVVQGTCGQGWVILTGVHPEAPETWRRGMHFKTPTSADQEYAGKLVDAALNRKSLPHY